MRFRKRGSGFVVGRFLVLLLVLFLAVSVLCFRIDRVWCRSRLFSFVQIGDTQWANKTQLQSVVDFIDDNKIAFDIEYVVHMGDIVEVYYNRTDWEIKNSAFSQLTNIVSFGWLAGNHDGESEYYVGDDYFAFNVSNYPNMTSSYDQGRNTAQYFNFSGVEVLFVNLDYFAEEGALLWFESLYNFYDSAVVVFSTHSYLDFLGDYTQDTLRANYLDDFSRVRLVLCGHLVYAFNQQVSGRQEILFNYQRVPGYVPDLSDFIRIYSVYDDGSVDAITYSALRDQFLTDSSNQFTFTLFDVSTPTATPTPIPSSTPTPTLTPTLTPSPTPVIEPANTPTPTQQPTITPSPTPGAGDGSLPLEYIAAGIVAILVAVLVFVLRRK